MCGFLVALNWDGDFSNIGNFSSALNLLSHRGPDDQSVWKSDVITMGFRRLKVIDLSDAARQPMCCENTGVKLVFNGMIYNYKEVRDDLISRGHVFKTSSDTEVLLKSYIEYGENFVDVLRGMWAVVIWDERHNKLIATRDRFGIKPLYVFRKDGLLVFASEIKSILSLCGKFVSVSRERACRYLFRGWADDEGKTLFNEINPIPQGTIAAFTRNGEVSRRFWDLRPGMRATPNIAEFREKLIETARLHTRADVPVAVALSGGIDSAGMASILGKMGGTSVHSYTVVPPGTVDESPQSVIEQYGLIHKRVFMDDIDIEKEFANVIYANDEPVNGSNTIYQYALRREIKNDGVKVLITGEGADEAMAGYERTFPFFLSALLESGRLDDLPGAVKGGAEFLGVNERDVMKQWMGMLSARMRNVYHQLNEVGIGVVSDAAYNEYAKKIMATGYVDRPEFGDGRYLFECLYAHLFDKFIPHILRMEDRISSAFGIEGRVPYLDHELVEMAWSFPFHKFMENGWNKATLRSAMNGIIPAPLLEQRKKLRKPGNNVIVAYDQLHGHISDILAGSRCRNMGLHLPNAQDVFEQDVSGRHLNRAFIWLRTYMLDLFYDHVARFGVTVE